MKKKQLKRLTLTSETLRTLSGLQTKDVAAAGFRAEVTDGCDTEDNTCYWGCSFASCPAGGCEGA